MMSVRSNEEPDHFLESYWSDFKNFIKLIQKNLPVTISDNIKLTEWVKVLNIMKTNREYVNIEKQIEKYLAIIGWCLLKCESRYHFNIYLTNLKRWNKLPFICIDERRKDTPHETHFKHLNDNSIELYIDIFNSLTKKTKLSNPIYIKLFTYLQIPDYNNKDSVETTVNYNIKNIYEIIPELISEKRYSCLDCINKYVNMKKYLKDNYNLEIKSQHMSSRKYLAKLSKLY